jgi:osmotically inducible lipoprotein OsmB
MRSTVILCIGVPRDRSRRLWAHVANRRARLRASRHCNREVRLGIYAFRFHRRDCCEQRAEAPLQLSKRMPARLGSFRTYFSSRIVSYGASFGGSVRARSCPVRRPEMTAAIRWQPGLSSRPCLGAGDSTKIGELQYMSISILNMTLVALTALGLAACSTTTERFSGAGVGAVAGGSVAGPIGAVVGGVAGAVEGPTVATGMGVPHRRHHRHWRRYRHYWNS